MVSHVQNRNFILAPEADRSMPCQPWAIQMLFGAGSAFAAEKVDGGK
jgi:hypothetical protein